MTAIDIIPLLIVSIAVYLSIRMEKLTIAGAISGGLMAIVIYYGLGGAALLMLASFFIIGTVVTGIGRREKLAMGYSVQDKGKRRASQVLANGGFAALCAILAYLLPDKKLLLFHMLGAAFSSATADTMSSELGVLYGRRFVNILTFRKDVRGEDGVVSLEGTLIGLVGSVLIALTDFWATGDLSAALVVALAGLLGNISDSILGAALERKQMIGNDFVNFLNTAIAGLACLIMLKF